MANFTATAADAVGAGIVAGVVSWVGVEPQALIYAGMGATLGMGATPPAGRLRTLCMFLAVTMLCAALGHFVELHFYAGADKFARNLTSGISAALAYIVLGAVMASVPPFISTAFEGVLRKLGLKA
jgi:hypothetical protein